MKSISTRLIALAFAAACMASTLGYGSSSSSSSSEFSSCYDNPNIQANQVNYFDFYLSDLNREFFYSVFPNEFYTYNTEGGTGYFNTSTPGLFSTNPRNPKNIIGALFGDVVSINQQNPPYLFNGLKRNPFAISKDGGRSWNYSTAPTTHLSQSTSCELFFSPCGKVVYALGSFADSYTNPVSSSNPKGLFDFSYYTSYLPYPYGPASIFVPIGPIGVSNPSVYVSRNNGPTEPNTVLSASIASFGLGGTANPAAGIFLCKSTDGGRTFKKPVLISATQSNIFLGTLTGGLMGYIQGSNGLTDQTADNLLIDPHHSSILNVIWSRIDQVSFLWGSLYNSRSTDGGKSWSTNPNGDNHLMNITASPLYALEFDTNFANTVVSTDPNYLTNFPNVGQATSPGSIVVEDVGQGGNNGKPVYLCGFTRFYPRPNQSSPTFTDSPADTISDHGILISMNRGETWGDGVIFKPAKTNAVALPSYTFATAFDPRSSSPSIGLITFDGALNPTLAASPKTGRVYYVWEGGNANIDSNPLVNQYFPEIQMSVSSGSLDEIGQNWTDPVKVNLTPDNLTNPETSQAFNPNVAVNKDGIVAVVYSDFRNFDVSQVGNSSGTVLTTTWIAFYQELDCPTAGELGNGLTFIGELQVSPIYNTALYAGPPFTGITTGNYISLDVDANGNFVVAYPVTNTNNGTNPIPQVPFYTPYSNANYNITENTSNRSNVFIKVIPAPCT